MRRAGISTRLVSFGALLAFVWQVLAMAAGVSTQPASWAEACTPAGIVKVALADDARSATGGAGSVDCTWCQLMAGAAQPGPAPSLLPQRPASRSALVVRPETRDLSHTPWASLPIRAPPAVT